MNYCIRWVSCGAMLFAIVAGTVDAKEPKGKKAGKPKGESEATVSELKLPEKVRATFVDRFPNAVINKLESENEGGVTVWKIEFRDRRTQKETEIADDGTMLAYSVGITKKTMPKSAMKKLEAAAKRQDAEMGRMERIEISYETKDGKVVKLNKPATRYAVEMIKDMQTAEIVVDEKGKVIEEPNWEAKATEKKSAA